VSPSRLMSTAPTCSTRTRVDAPSTVISGRNVAGLALLDVGATRTVERGRRASACTTMARATPSWPSSRRAPPRPPRRLRPRARDMAIPHRQRRPTRQSQRRTRQPPRPRTQGRPADLLAPNPHLHHRRQRPPRTRQNHRPPLAGVRRDRPSGVFRAPERAQAANTGGGG